MTEFMDDMITNQYKHYKNTLKDNLIFLRQNCSEFESVNDYVEFFGIGKRVLYKYESYAEEKFPPMEYVVKVAEYNNYDLGTLFTKNLKSEIELDNKSGFITNTHSEKYSRYFEDSEDETTFYIYFYRNDYASIELIEGTLEISRKKIGSRLDVVFKYPKAKETPEDMYEYSGTLKISTENNSYISLYGNKENVHITFIFPQGSKKIVSHVGLAVSSTTNGTTRIPIEQKMLISRYKLDTTNNIKLKSYLNMNNSRVIVNKADIIRIFDEINIEHRTFFNYFNVNAYMDLNFIIDNTSQAKNLPIELLHFFSSPPLKELVEIDISRIMGSLMTLDTNRVFELFNCKVDQLHDLISKLRYSSIIENIGKISTGDEKDFYEYIKTSEGYQSNLYINQSALK